ncbi:hypothetical protein AALP_AA2G252600 [Arabis alpina]|uniref:Uncharacterized protein n=1 Tax=Arabis alpina TaxID=50452 RepID=A0A087HJV6_ARAAL|nr:hypothetical protein AALP_AA2G252600 [Arabis alpina]
MVMMRMQWRTRPCNLMEVTSEDRRSVSVSVRGYDPSLSDSEIEIAAHDLFSSCDSLWCLLRDLTQLRRR